MLEMKRACERCRHPLPPTSAEALICSFECTFCRPCADRVLESTCPNCGGNLSPRPVRLHGGGGSPRAMGRDEGIAAHGADAPPPQARERDPVDRRLEYDVTVRWEGNRGTGTSTYTAYGRDHRITAGDRPPIPGSADPLFRGDPLRYSPEDLLVAAASACHMLWYLHLCADAGVTVLDYEDRARGRMSVSPAGGGAFDEVVLRPRIVLEPGADVELAGRLHRDAHDRCFIANSLRCPVRCEPALELRGGDRTTEGETGT
jgi:organic hydroperoxide reductase OsmC/OhrA